MQPQGFSATKLLTRKTKPSAWCDFTCMLCLGCSWISVTIKVRSENLKSIRKVFSQPSIFGVSGSTSGIARKVLAMFNISSVDYTSWIEISSSFLIYSPKRPSALQTNSPSYTHQPVLNKSHKPSQMTSILPCNQQPRARATCPLQVIRNLFPLRNQLLTLSTPCRGRVQATN